MAGLFSSLISATLAFSLASYPAQSVPPTTSAALVRVFVHSEEPGQSPTLAALRQSASDLAGAIADRKKTLVIVRTEAEADLIVEVLDRGLNVPKVVMGLGPPSGSPSSIAGMTGPVRVPVLRVKLTLGVESPMFTNKNQPAESARGWKSAADDIAAQIEKWAKSHHEDILKHRR